MKDLFKRIWIITFFGLFTWYLVYSILNWVMIVNPQYIELNYIFYAILIILSLYIAVYYGIYPMHIKFSRAILFVIGIASIIMGKTVLANNGIEGVFFWDIACVFWVITLIIGPTGLIFTQKVKKQKEERELEIIEV